MLQCDMPLVKLVVVVVVVLVVVSDRKNAVV